MFYFISVVRMISISMDSSQRLTLLVKNHTTLTDFTPLANISVSNPPEAVTSSNNLLAYRLRFRDIHNSNLAAVFINIEGVFPCTQLLSNYFPKKMMDFVEEKL